MDRVATMSIDFAGHIHVAAFWASDNNKSGAEVLSKKGWTVVHRLGTAE